MVEREIRDMTFIGSDFSVCEYNPITKDIHVFYGTSNGLSFRDIAHDKSITLSENLFIHGLRHTGIEALDLYMIYTNPDYDDNNLMSYGRLLQDTKRLQEIRTNITLLTHHIALGNPCSFYIISQSQKHANRLEESIQDRKAAIDRATSVFREN